MKRWQWEYFMGSGGYAWLCILRRDATGKVVFSLRVGVGDVQDHKTDGAGPRMRVAN
jgi:hypothetical protein